VWVTCASQLKPVDAEPPDEGAVVVPAEPSDDEGAVIVIAVDQSAVGR
jgi:hypothetical protein